jgi:hypothetical protein
MPFRGKKSRIAKQKHQNAQAAFAKQTSTPNPNSSDYYVSDSDSNKSVISVDRQVCEGTADPLLSVPPSPFAPQGKLTRKVPEHE